jgi:hypothetical protein
MCKTTQRKNSANPGTQNPAGPKPPALPPIKPLKQYLDAAYAAEKANLEPSSMMIGGFTLKSKDFAISIRVLDDTGDHYAGIKDNDMYYSGSLVKVGALYAAHDLRAAARLHAATQTFADEASFRTSLASAVNPTGAVPKLRAMSVGLAPSLKDILVGFKPSGPNKVEFLPAYQNHLNDVLHNPGARGIIRPLGYSYINVSLMRSHFFNPATENGIWLAGDYSGDLPKPQRLPVERVPVVNDTVPGGSAQAITTKEMSRMFRLVHSKTGFSHITDQTEHDAANQDMHTILKTQASFFHKHSDFTEPIKFTDHCAKVGIGNLGPVDSPGPEVDSEGAVMDWTVPDPPATNPIDAFNSAHQRQVRGRFVVVWQNHYPSNTSWNAIIRIINGTMENFLAQS